MQSGQSRFGVASHSACARTPRPRWQRSMPWMRFAGALRAAKGCRSSRHAACPTFEALELEPIQCVELVRLMERGVRQRNERREDEDPQQRVDHPGERHDEDAEGHEHNQLLPPAQLEAGDRQCLILIGEYEAV